LLKEHPEDLKNKHLLANCYHLLARATFELPEVEAAQRLFQKALERIEPLAEANPEVHEYQAELAGVHSDLGVFFANKDPPDPAQALDCYRRAAAVLQPLVEKHPGIPGYCADAAATFRAIGVAELLQGRLDQAAGHLQTSLSHAEELVKRHPDNQQYVTERDDTRYAIKSLQQEAAKRRSP
jgi:tetratricopeptide (TPR) repeat protein